MENLARAKPTARVEPIPTTCDPRPRDGSRTSPDPIPMANARQIEEAAARGLSTLIYYRGVPRTAATDDQKSSSSITVGD